MKRAALVIGGAAAAGAAMALVVVLAFQVGFRATADERAVLHCIDDAIKQNARADATQAAIIRCDQAYPGALARSIRRDMK